MKRKGYIMKPIDNTNFIALWVKKKTLKEVLIEKIIVLKGKLIYAFENVFFLLIVVVMLLLMIPLAVLYSCKQVYELYAQFIELLLVRFGFIK